MWAVSFKLVARRDEDDEDDGWIESAGRTGAGAFDGVGSAFLGCKPTSEEDDEVLKPRGARDSFGRPEGLKAGAGW